MAFVKKTWKNRVSEFFNRYRVENVQTGAISKVYMNLDDGAVTQEGDVIDADTMNDLEGRIEDGFDETYKSTDSVETSIDDADYIPFYDTSAQAMKKISKSNAQFGGNAEIYISGVESTSTASQAYVTGQYLIYNAILYKVIDAIVQGDTLVVGTNISATNVGNELTNHLVVNGSEFYFDYQNGKYGYNTSANRGADTFFPFSSDSGDTAPLRFSGSGTISANGGSVNGGAWGESGGWSVFCNSSTNGNIVNIQLPLSYVNIETTTLTNATASLTNGKLIIALSGSSTGPQADSRSARSYTTLSYEYDVTVSVDS